MSSRRLQPHEVIKTKSVMSTCFKKPINDVTESMPEIFIPWDYNWFNRLSFTDRQQRLKRNAARTKRRKNAKK